MKIVHYRKNCIGCNSCVEHAPDIWEISEEDGKAVLKGAKHKGDADVLEVVDEEKHHDASRDCPSRIIKVFK